MPTTAVASDKDPFDDLPDDILRCILRFLPGDDALQTCVLGTRWRNIWRDTTRLSFAYRSWSSPWSSPTLERFEKLANLIIHVRGDSPLTYCEINPFKGYVDGRTTFACTQQLIEYVLQCRAMSLVVRPGVFYHGELPPRQPDNDDDDGDDVPLPLNERLISCYLRTIVFEYVAFEQSSLDFSGCPKLLTLRLGHCGIYVPRIVSESLKHLKIFDECAFPDQYRIQIYTPRLISLELSCGDGVYEAVTPLLEKMPLLQTAIIRIGSMCIDYCQCNGPSCPHWDEECVLLNGLSNAVHLELTAAPETSIFRWDLKSCPIFGKLKTLVLNEWWFMATDIVCILQHSPVLKKLTLMIEYTENVVGATATIPQETIEQPILCASLLVVKIYCLKNDQGVREICKILSTYGIPYKQISIKEVALRFFQ